jgi:hypothetical protein
MIPRIPNKLIIILSFISFSRIICFAHVETVSFNDLLIINNDDPHRVHCFLVEAGFGFIDVHTKEDKAGVIPYRVYTWESPSTGDKYVYEFKMNENKPGSDSFGWYYTNQRETINQIIHDSSVRKFKIVLTKTDKEGYKTNLYQCEDSGSNLMDQMTQLIIGEKVVDGKVLYRVTAF